MKISLHCNTPWIIFLWQSSLVIPGRAASSQVFRRIECEWIYLISLKPAQATYSDRGIGQIFMPKHFYATKIKFRVKSKIIGTEPKFKTYITSALFRKMETRNEEKKEESKKQKRAQLKKKKKKKKRKPRRRRNHKGVIISKITDHPRKCSQQPGFIRSKRA